MAAHRQSSSKALRDEAHSKASSLVFARPADPGAGPARVPAACGRSGCTVITLYYHRGACSTSNHFALEEAGIEYGAIKVDLKKLDDPLCRRCVR